MTACQFFSLARVQKSIENRIPEVINAPLGASPRCESQFSSVRLNPTILIAEKNLAFKDGALIIAYRKVIFFVDFTRIGFSVPSSNPFKISTSLNSGIKRVISSSRVN
jgi:hypothetical protein